MPTGYTEMIDREPKLSTEKWIMEGLARAFGVCVTLRDDDMNLTEEQVEQRLIKDGKQDCDYHRKELAKANKEALTISKKSLADWETEWTQAEAEKSKHNQESIVKANIVKSRHLQIKEDLEEILENNIHPTTRNIVKFGLDQLKLAESDTEPYIQEPMTLQQYILEQKKSNLWSIKYHTDELSKALDRAEGRLESYRQLKQDIASASLHKDEIGGKKE